MCDSGTVWLSEIEAPSVYYQCGTCLRAFEFYSKMIVWWPNEEGVLPPLDGIEAIAKRLRQPKSYTIAVIPHKEPIMEPYTIRVKEMTE